MAYNYFVGSLLDNDITWVGDLHPISAFKCGEFAGV